MKPRTHNTISRITTPTIWPVAASSRTDHAFVRLLGTALSALALMGLSAAEVVAQVPIDAGAVMRNIGSADPSRMALDAATQRELYPPEWRIDPSDSTPYLVQGFEIRGNHRLTAEALLQSLSPYLHQTVPLGQTTQWVQEVARRYKDAGVDARVYLPKQNPQRAKLLIQVIETPQVGKR